MKSVASASSGKATQSEKGQHARCRDDVRFECERVSWSTTVGEGEAVEINDLEGCMCEPVILAQSTDGPFQTIGDVKNQAATD